MTRRALTVSIGLGCVALLVLLFVCSVDGEPTGTQGDVAGARDAERDALRAQLRGTSDPAGEGGGVDGARADPNATHGPVTVTVLGFSGVPLAGVPVCRDSRKPDVGVLTDEAGRAVFADVPWDGSAHVSLCVAGVQSADSKMVATVGGSRVELRGIGVPVSLRPRHAGLGTAMARRWRVVTPAFWGYEGREAVQVAAIRPGTYRTIKFELDRQPSSRGVAWEPTAMWGPVAPSSEKLVFEYPLRPEAQIEVVFPSDVPPEIISKWEPQAVVGPYSRKVKVVADAFGRSRLVGVAHLVSERVRLYGTVDDWRIHGTALLGYDADQSVRIELVAERITDDDVIKDEEIEDHMETDNDLPYQESFGDGGKPPATQGVRLRVLHPDGRPARGAIVNVRMVLKSTTNEDGWVDLGEFLVGDDLDCSVWGAGAPLVRKLKVKAGIEELTLRGIRGGTIRVEAVDPKGRPLPFAFVNVLQPSQLPWTDMQGTTQRIDSYTDHLGKRTCHTIEPGLVRVRIYCGRRSAEREVPVVNGETTSVTIEVPDAK